MTGRPGAAWAFVVMSGQPRTPSAKPYPRGQAGTPRGRSAGPAAEVDHHVGVIWMPTAGPAGTRTPKSMTMDRILREDREWARPSNDSTFDGRRRAVHRDARARRRRPRMADHRGHHGRQPVLHGRRGGNRTAGRTPRPAAPSVPRRLIPWHRRPGPFRRRVRGTGEPARVRARWCPAVRRRRRTSPRRRRGPGRSCPRPGCCTTRGRRAGRASTTSRRCRSG